MRLSPSDKRTFAETAYKRLFWQGYKGRFGIFTWSTELAPGTHWYDALDDPQNLDRSEEKAYEAASVLWDVLANLNVAYPRKVRLLAHSLGSVVASEALRRQGQTFGQQLVHTYVMSQGATVGNAYDAAIPWRDAPLNGWETPDVYSSYFTAAQSAAGGIVNFFNPIDWALSPQVWEFNQNTKPDIGRGGYDVNPGTGLQQFYRLNGQQRVWLSLDDMNDRHFIYSYLAEGHTIALGRTSGAHGIITADVNLATTLGFGNRRWWHSGQFSSDNMTVGGYWSSLLTHFGIPST